MGVAPIGLREHSQGRNRVWKMSPPTTKDSNVMGQGVTMDCWMVEKFFVALRDEAGLQKVALWRVTETGWRVSLAYHLLPSQRKKITPELGKGAPFALFLPVSLYPSPLTKPKIVSANKGGVLIGFCFTLRMQNKKL